MPVQNSGTVPSATMLTARPTKRDGEQRGRYQQDCAVPAPRTQHDAAAADYEKRGEIGAQGSQPAAVGGGQAEPGGAAGGIDQEPDADDGKQQSQQEQGGGQDQAHDILR